MYGGIYQNVRVERAHVNVRFPWIECLQQCTTVKAAVRTNWDKLVTEGEVQVNFNSIFYYLKIKQLKKMFQVTNMH